MITRGKGYDKVLLIEHAIDNYFGERCPEYEEGCVCCELWKFFDKITENYLTNPDESAK